MVENQYFPCINWITVLFSNTHINIYSFEQYRKMSFRNRCVVAGSNGPVHLSVPVENGRSQRVPFKDVRISYQQDWQTNHWRTLTSCYNKSAFFEFYRDAVEKFFLKKEVFLFDLDTNILLWLKEVLKADCKIDIVDEPVMEADATLTDVRDKWLPKNFTGDGLGDGNKTWHTSPKYFQVFENKTGFLPNLSILDLLFNEGPNAAMVIKQLPPIGGIV